MLFNPFGYLREEAHEALLSSLRKMGVEEEPHLVPAPPEKGDLALPTFPLAKKLRSPPHKIASKIVQEAPSSPSFSLRAEGGYVNVHFHPTVLSRLTLESVFDLGPSFGSLPSRGVRILLEHTSANPNGPFHVGRARNPIVGDSLARILRAAGYDVTTEYYVNDIGKQVALLVWGLSRFSPKDLPDPRFPKPDHDLVRYYQKAHALLEENPSLEEEVQSMLRRVEGGDPAELVRFREAASKVLEGMKESLRRLNVTIDSYFWESDLVRSGAVQRVVERLLRSPRARSKEGAYYLEWAESEGGDPEGWVFLRRDGTTLYTTRDLAYHEEKFRRAERVVNVLGEDHKLTMQHLLLALREIGVERAPEVVWISFVSLPEGKMSTRRGRVVFLDELLEEAVERALEEVQKRRGSELSEEELRSIAQAVGIGAVRFNIASVQSEKGIVFRWEEALNFEGDSAPFVQYAHARASGILEKAGTFSPKLPSHPELLSDPSEQRLLRAIARLPDVVEESAKHLRVYPIATHAIELATSFNAFYRDCPVLGAESDDVREARMALVWASKIALGRALEWLGVEALESM